MIDETQTGGTTATDGATDAGNKPEAAEKPAKPETEAQRLAREAKEAQARAKELQKQAKERREADKTERARVKDLNAGVNAIIAERKAGTLAEGDVEGRILALNAKPEELQGIRDKVAGKTKTRQPRLPKTETPALTLTHSLISAGRGAFEPPTDGGRPDVTLTNSLRRWGFILPLVAVQLASGLLRILDGKRRYWLIGETETVPVVVVSGFPDEATEEAASVMVNRIRSLNVLATSGVIMRARQRGKTDAELRRDLGFKTGEVDKLAGLGDLPAGISNAVKAGAIAPAVALEITKLPRNLQERLATDYASRVTKAEAEKEGSGAQVRITEAHVEEARQARASEAVNRDADTLRGLTGSVDAADVGAAEDKAEDASTGEEGGDAPANP